MGCCFPEKENTKVGWFCFFFFFSTERERLKSDLKLAVVCQVQL